MSLMRRMSFSLSACVAMPVWPEWLGSGPLPSPVVPETRRTMSSCQEREKQHQSAIEMNLTTSACEYR